jgi:DNA-binding transcriptional MerR regulator
VRIGLLAERTGASVPTIRYYEQIGLLRRAGRRNGRREYDNEDVRRVAFIRRCRQFDFSIEQIRTLLLLVQANGPCAEARLAAERHLAVVRSRLAELSALETSIASLIVACKAGCDGGAVSDCVIVQDWPE